MMKFYHNKEVSLEKSPILLQLQRRHTLMEGDEDEDNKLKPASRSNSTSSMDKTQLKSFNMQNSIDDKTMSADVSGSFSNASTVVITESELSSSWLYKNKKEQMNTSEPYNSTCDSTAQLANEKKIPRHPRPNVKPTVEASGRSKKSSSCCCYTLIILIICLSSLGILSGIGSVLYMEYFAAHNEVDNTTTSEASTTNDTFGVTYDDFYPMRRKIELPDNQTILHQSSNQIDESPYSKLFDLYKGFHNNNSANRNLSVASPNLDENNLKTELDINSNKSLEDLNQNLEIDNGKLQNWGNSNSDFPESFGFEETANRNNAVLSKEHQTILHEKPKEFDFKDMFEPEVGEMQENGADLSEKFQPNIPMFVPQELEDENTNVSNSFRMFDGDFETDGLEENLINSDLSEEPDWSRPVLETNIAVPRPIEIMRSLNSKRASPDFSDHDRQFSLAKALERLRLLDTNNILPESRLKRNDVKKPVPKNELKVQSKQEVVTERSQYLKHLRTKLFNQ